MPSRWSLYEALAIRDIRGAADLLRPVYNATSRGDGYVSLEVSPYLAHDTDSDHHGGSPPVEGRRPGERDDQGAGLDRGMPAIRQLTSEGINVNITLLFGIEATNRLRGRKWKVFPVGSRAGVIRPGVAVWPVSS